MHKYMDVGAKLDHITHEISELKKIIVEVKLVDAQRTEDAWNDLMSASEEVTKLWKGKSAVEEIKDQREKAV